MKKSLAVMANYLFSYQHFLTIQDALRDAIGDLATSDFYTLHEDLQYLLGTELVDTVKNLLKLCHYKGGGLSNWHAQISNVDFVIPLNYQVDYNYQWQSIINASQVEIMQTCCFPVCSARCIGR